MFQLRRIPLWVDIVWLLLLGLYVQVGMYIVPLHGDETPPIFMGRDFYYHFIENDLSKIRYDESRYVNNGKWSIPFMEQEFRLLNGTIPKYINGMGCVYQRL